MHRWLAASHKKPCIYLILRKSVTVKWVLVGSTCKWLLNFIVNSLLACSSIKFWIILHYLFSYHIHFYDIRWIVFIEHYRNMMLHTELVSCKQLRMELLSCGILVSRILGALNIWILKHVYATVDVFKTFSLSWTSRVPVKWFSMTAPLARTE